LLIFYVSNVSNLHLFVGSKLVPYADDKLLFKPISNDNDSLQKQCIVLTGGYHIVEE